MSLENLSDLVKNVLIQKGWHFNVAMYEKDHPQVFTSLIDGRWNIELVAHSNLEQILQGVVEKEGLQHIFPDPVSTLLYTSMTHEGGHWENCPYDINQCEEILHGTFQGLKSSSISESDMPLFIGRAANFFDDIIDDTLNSIYDKNSEEYVKGLALRMVLFREMDNSVFGTQHFSKTFTVYADLLARLTGMPQELREKISTAYHPEMPELESVVKDTLGVLLEDKDLAERVYAGDLSPAVKSAVASKFSDKMSWGSKSQQFAGLVASYLIEEPEESTKAICNYILVALGLIDPGTGLGKSIATQQSLTSRMPIGLEDEEDEEPRGDPNVRQQILSVGIGKGHEVSYVSRFELLDMLYRERAEEIVLQILDQKKRQKGSIISYLDRERVVGDFDLSLIDWPRTLIINRGGKNEVVLYQKDLPLEGNDPVDVMRGEIPDLAFIVDSSGSMRADLVRGYGPYDLLLRSIYSIFNWLERDRKGYQMQFSVVNFSGRTLFSGWHPFSEINKIKRALFRYQGGGTVLDAATLDRLVEERKDRFLAFLVTDSAIANVNEVEKAILRLVDAGNYLVHFHIGSQLLYQLPPGLKLLSRFRGFSDDLPVRLADKGLDVRFLSNPADLIGLSVKYTEKVYGGLK